jgi:hypothetical protein
LGQFPARNLALIYLFYNIEAKTQTGSNYNLVIGCNAFTDFLDSTDYRADDNSIGFNPRGIDRKGIIGYETCRPCRPGIYCIQHVDRLFICARPKADCLRARQLRPSA